MEVGLNVNTSMQVEKYLKKKLLNLGRMQIII
jgi:hypothetical protein